MTEQESSRRMPPWLNRFMTFILRSPLHGIASRSVMLITFTGAKSGRTYTTPISYARDGEVVLAFTGGRWWRNLEGGAPVTLHIKRKIYRGTATPTAEDKEAVAAGLREFLNTVRFDARIYGVKFDEDGWPNWQDVRRAAQSTIMIHIQLSEEQFS